MSLAPTQCQAFAHTVRSLWGASLISFNYSQSILFISGHDCVVKKKQLKPHHLRKNRTDWKKEGQKGNDVFCTHGRSSSQGCRKRSLQVLPRQLTEEQVLRDYKEELSEHQLTKARMNCLRPLRKYFDKGRQPLCKDIISIRLFFFLIREEPLHL